MAKTAANTPSGTPARTDAPPVHEQANDDPAARLHTRLVRRKLFESSITALVFVVLFAAFGLWLGASFLNVNARLLDLHQNTPILLLGLAGLVTLVPGLFDLSIAGVATLTCFLVIGLRTESGWPFPVVVLTGLAVGVLVGLVNGFVVERLRVNAFIATLGTGGICTGLSSVYSGGTLLSPTPDGPQLPDWFVSLGTFQAKAPTWVVVVAILCAFATLFFSLDRVRPPSWSRRRWTTAKAAVLVVLAALLVFVFRIPQWVSGVSWMIFLLLCAAAVLWVVLDYTSFGRHLRAIGSNRPASLLAGVKVRRQVMKTFMVGGFLSSLAGLTLAASQGTASPDAAGSFLLPAFAAAFLSTVVLSHGRFTVPGTILGGIFVVWVGLALILGGLDATWIPVVNGLILVGAVALSTAMRRRT